MYLDGIWLITSVLDSPCAPLKSQYALNILAFLYPLQSLKDKWKKALLLLIWFNSLLKWC